MSGMYKFTSFKICYSRKSSNGQAKIMVRLHEIVNYKTISFTEKFYALGPLNYSTFDPQKTSDYIAADSNHQTHSQASREMIKRIFQR